MIIASNEKSQSSWFAEFPSVSLGGLAMIGARQRWAGVDLRACRGLIVELAPPGRLPTPSTHGQRNDSERDLVANLK